jgi:TolB protein
VVGAVGLVVLTGAGIGGYLLLGNGDGDGVEPPPPTTSAPAPTPAPLLPQGRPLPETTLVVPRAVDDETDLYLVDAGGGVGQRLTTAPGEDVGPLISADRSTIVYQHAFAPGQYELRAMGTDGSGDRVLPVEGCPSPDRPAWNPADRTQLAVACTIEGRTDLRIVTVDGTTVRDDLDPGVPYLSDLTFSLDGTRVVYWGTDTPADGHGHLYSLPVDGSAGATRLTDVGGDADPVFSPDGTEIAFRRAAGGESRIYVMAADGSDEQPVTSRGGFDQDPTWSPDGQSIAFKSNRPGDHPGDQVWVVDRSGDGLRQLRAPDGVAVNAPAWSNR